MTIGLLFKPMVVDLPGTTPCDDSTQSLDKIIDQPPYKDLAGSIKCENTRYPVGAGGYGRVFRGVYTTEAGERINVAIKILSIVKDEPNKVEKIKRYVHRETTVWHKLRHQNVLEFLGVASDLGEWGCPALISPYCENETITHYLMAHPEANRFNMFQGVAAGLAYLHEVDVVHGDVKPSNILIDDEGNPLLCDFGRSKILRQRGFTTKPAAALRYAAPETLDPSDESYTNSSTKETDIYGFGLSCYEIWTGLQPYHEFENPAFLIVHLVTTTDSRPTCPTPAPPGHAHLWPIFEKCWNKRPKERASAQEVLQLLRSLPCLLS